MTVNPCKSPLQYPLQYITYFRNSRHAYLCNIFVLLSACRTQKQCRKNEWQNNNENPTALLYGRKVICKFYTFLLPFLFQQGKRSYRTQYYIPKRLGFRYVILCPMRTFISFFLLLLNIRRPINAASTSWGRQYFCSNAMGDEQKIEMSGNCGEK